MQKQRKTVKQDKIIIVQPLNKVKDLQLLLKGYRQQSEAQPLNGFAVLKFPCCPQACRPQTGWNQKVDIDSRLPYHQPIRRISTILSHALHTPFLSCCLKNLCLKATGEFVFFEPSLLGLHAWHPKIMCIFLHHNSVSINWLYCTQVNRSKFGLIANIFILLKIITL